jgi:CBS domain-containing protein
MSQIKVRDIMTHDPFIISPEKTVKDAARLMKDIDCGVLPVGTHPEKVIGMITDRDITLRVTAEGKDANHTLIRDVMTQRVHSCDAATDIEDAAEQMRKHDVCRLLVTKDNLATGIVTLAELLRNKHELHTSDKVLHELLGVRKKHRTKPAKTA